MPGIRVRELVEQILRLSRACVLEGTQAREHVHEALEEGVWDQELRPLRNVMSRARFKLRHLGLDAVSLVETGYLLMENPRSKAT